MDSKSSVRRVLVISDLHIGGEEFPMMGNPHHLVNFLDQLAEYNPGEGEQVELVINSDFIDFLAEKPYQAWTLDEDVALVKLKNVFRNFGDIFKALAKCLQKGTQLTLYSPAFIGCLLKTTRKGWQPKW